MPENSIKKHPCYQYLLGRLSEQQEEQFEAEYFAQPERSHELWAVFDEMVENFVRREMDADAAQAFAAQLQTKPFLRARAERLHSLYNFLSQTPLPQATATESAPSAATSFRNWFTFPAWGWGTLAVSLVILGLVGIFLLRRTDHRAPEIAQAEPPTVSSTVSLAMATTTPQPIASASAKIKAETTPLPSQRPNVTPFYILLEETRGRGEAKTISITSQTQTIALHFEVSPPLQPTYQGTIQTNTGKVVRTFSDLKVNQQKGTAFITLRLGVAELSSQNFNIQIRATTTDKNAPPLLKQEFHLEKE